MTNIYEQIQAEQKEQVHQQELDTLEYTEAYNRIKQNKAVRFMKGTILFVIEILLYALALLAIILLIRMETWDTKAWNELLNDGADTIPTSGAEALSAGILFCKIIVVAFTLLTLFIRWLIGKIRKKNKVIYEQSDLLEKILTKAQANLTKARESQKQFELFASEIVKKQMEGK